MVRKLPQLRNAEWLLCQGQSYNSLSGWTKLTERSYRPPAEEFPDSCTDIGKTILVFQCWHARSSNDAFELLLALPLLLWIGDHGEYEPDHGCGSLRKVSSIYRVYRITTHCIGTSGTARDVNDSYHSRTGTKSEVDLLYRG